jgi:hypothetical protein
VNNDSPPNLDRCAFEMGGMPPITVQFDAAALMSVISVIQLAARHPASRSFSSISEAVGFVRSVQKIYPAECQKLIECGFDPGFDVTVKRQACRECGCTEELACPEGCYWVEDDLCSACAIRMGLLPAGEA